MFVSDKIEPGSVSLLALINDEQNAVEVVIDQDVWKSDALQCHPLVNTSTLVVSQSGIEKFLSASKHEPRVVDVPSK